MNIKKTHRGLASPRNYWSDRREDQLAPWRGSTTLRHAILVTTVTRGVKLLAEFWEPESACLLEIPMLATRGAVGYFRDRHFGLCGFGIMDGAGGGLGHDVTVPGSHVIIGNLE